MKGAAITIAVIIAFFGAIHLWDEYLFPAYANWRGFDWKVSKGIITARGPYIVEDGEARPMHE